MEGRGFTLHEWLLEQRILTQSCEFFSGEIPGPMFQISGSNILGARTFLKHPQNHAHRQLPVLSKEGPAVEFGRVGVSVLHSQVSSQLTEEVLSRSKTACVLRMCLTAWSTGRLGTVHTFLLPGGWHHGLRPGVPG